jgi:NAD(P)-dependent dehydrogenase (short-subunit alcohol dehydrogenase family)
VRLAGKAGLVTGAGRGIGREIALALAREGAAVLVNDAGVAVDGRRTTERPAAEVAAEIAGAGGQAAASYDSVASWDGAHAIVAQAVAAFGGLDFVVNNAGIVRDVIFHKMSEADWDDVMAVHLKGTFNVSRAAAPHLRARGGGSVVNMTSTSGLVGNLGQANYAAAKLGVVALTRAIALDMRRFGVRANAIAPFAWTRITETIPGTDASRVQALQALKPAQVAPLATFLVSDEARDVTGQVFAVRGSEILLFSQPRPVRSAYRPGGWSTENVGDGVRSLVASFVPLEVTADVFPYPPLI